MKLLLAEDEKELSRATVTLLQINGYEMDAAYDGEEALKLAEANHYDGYILDIMMPKVDGITVLKKLRESGDTAPILMLTAKASVDDKVLGLDEGANDYLTKPYAIKELVARIKVMLRDSIQMLPEELAIGNFRINREEQRLESSSSSVSLNLYECRMLELFMSHPDYSFSTEQLFEKIWCGKKDITVVSVYIFYLNSKLHSVQAQAEIIESDSHLFHLELTV